MEFRSVYRAAGYGLNELSMFTELVRAQSSF